MCQELLRGLQADAFDLTKLRRQSPAGSAFTVKINGKAMALISDLLNEPEDRRTPLKDHGFVLAAGDINDLFLLCDTRQRLIDDVQFVESRLCRMQLADASVNEDKIGHAQSFILDSLVTP